MSEFIQNHLFQIINLVITVGSFCVAFGMMKQQLKTQSDELVKIQAITTAQAARLDAHIGQPDIHITPLFNQLLDLKLDNIRLQITQTSDGVKRIEGKVDDLSAAGQKT